MFLCAISVVLWVPVVKSLGKTFTEAQRSHSEPLRESTNATRPIFQQPAKRVADEGPFLLAPTVPHNP